MPETPSTPITPSRTEHPERPERPDRPERADRPERPARPARPAQPSRQGATDTDLSDVVANMQASQAARDANIPNSQVLADAGVQPAPVPVTVVESDEEPKPVVMADTVPPPGLTEQGWSPEVTARHPQLLTETMAELLAEMSDADESVDPTDPGSLQRAQTALASIETDLDNLRARAAAINAQRLGEALEAARGASAAMRAAVDEAKAALSQPQA